MKNTIYLAQLERFGYTLTAVAETKKEATKIVMDEYIRAFKKYNGGEDPRRTPSDYYAGETAYKSAKDDMSIIDITKGKCEWL